MGPTAQRFGEWASASRTFSITDLIAVVQREVDGCVHLLLHACVLHLLLPAYRDCCWLQLRSRRQDITTRRGDGAPCRPSRRLRVGVSPGLIDRRCKHPLSPFLCDKTKTPAHCSCSGKAPVFGGQARALIALRNKKPSTFFMRRDFDGP